MGWPKGVKLSPETLEKMKKNGVGRPKGMKLSAETLEKMKRNGAGRRKGSRNSEEGKARMKGVVGMRKVWTDEIIEQIGLALEEWSKKEDSMYLGRFVIDQDILPEHLSRFGKDNEFFYQKLIHAKMRLAERLRERLNKRKYHYALFDREIGMYDIMLHQYEREEKIFDAELKAKYASQTPVAATVVVTDYSKATQIAKPSKSLTRPERLRKEAPEVD